MNSKTIIQNIMETKSYTFDIELNQGVACPGFPVINEFDMEVELSDEEVASIRSLVSQASEEQRKEGLMPLLEKGNPELHKRFEEAARSAIFDFLVMDGINQGFIELNEEELRRNFEKDLEEGFDDWFIPTDYIDYEAGLSEEEEKEQLYDAWKDFEQDRLSEHDLDWIRSRYSVDDSVDIEGEEFDYICFIPEEFLS